MTRMLSLVILLAHCFAAVSLTGAEIVDLGSGRVQTFAAVNGPETPPLARCEWIEGPAPAIRLMFSDQSSGARLTLEQARGVHELLGYVLAMAADDQPPQTTDAGTPSDTADTAASDEPTSDAPTPDSHPFLGMNLADVTYYSREWVFTDLILQSDIWRKDNRGYIFKSGCPPPGIYTCIWSGTGTVTFSGDATARQTGPNSAAVKVRMGEHGIDLKRSGDVGRVTLMKLEHETRTSPFMPELLDRLQPFRVIRFMDWANTNNSTHQRWSDRTMPNQVPQAGKQGVAIEYMIKLSNELKADPWFCIPHMADEDYIRRFATLVKDRIHPDATIYLEYSNEVWNSQFRQHDYIRRLGDGKTYSDRFFDAWADRCRTTFQIWSDVFGEDRSRLVRVAAVHLQNPWVAEKLLPRMIGEFDAIAPSAYFGVTPEQERTLNEHTTADELLDLCERNIRKDNTRWYQAHGRLARDWSARTGRRIRLIAYEGGQHLSAHSNDKLPYYDLLISVQKHPRMYDLYRMNLDAFRQAGGDLFVAFNDVSKPGKHGAWGHLEYQTQPIEHAPKYRALIEYVSGQ